MELIKLLKTDSRKGPPTQFHPWHLLIAFYTFCQSPSPIGRYQLGSDLGLGGGSIRSLIRFLRQSNLIEPRHRQGHQLSSKGQRYCNELNQSLIKFVELPQSSYTIDVCNFGGQLRHLAHRVTDGVFQRDAAIQAGASGATTLVQDANMESLIMVKNHRIQKDELTDILKPFTFEPTDVLIIGSGSNRTAAKLGTFAAIFTLLD